MIARWAWQKKKTDDHIENISFVVRLYRAVEGGGTEVRVVEFGGPGLTEGEGDECVYVACVRKKWRRDESENSITLPL